LHQLARRIGQGFSDWAEKQVSISEGRKSFRRSKTQRERVILVQFSG
jgi:hypothetical protein